MLEALKKSYENLKAAEEDENNETRYTDFTRGVTRSLFLATTYANMPALLEAAEFVGLISRLKLEGEWDEDCECVFSPSYKDSEASLVSLIKSARTIKENLK